jgi:hypothetical protein
MLASACARNCISIARRIVHFTPCRSAHVSEQQDTCAPWQHEQRWPPTLPFLHGSAPAGAISMYG